MASGNQTVESQPDPEQEKRWELSRRSDLANAFGIIVSVPIHRDDGGTSDLGYSPSSGMVDELFLSDFEAEMCSLVIAHASSLVSAGLLTEQQAQSIESHPYSIGPAAQELPQFFIELYRDAQPFMNDGASLLGWGYFFRELVKAMKLWIPRKQQRVEESRNGEAVIDAGWSEPSFTSVLTSADLISLCYYDLKTRYGIGGNVTIDTFPRSFTGFATPDHPAGQVTYLIRFKASKRNFFYLVDSEGDVTEHYLATGDDLTLLNLPELFDTDNFSQARQPHPSQRIRVRAR